MIVKALKLAAYTLLAYLFQATVSFYLALWDVAPNVALAMIAVVSVGLGRKYTFFMSLAVGYLLEIMLPSLSYINLLLYPVSAMLGALVFSDKSNRRIEEDRNARKATGTLNAHLRTPLCAMLSVLVFQAVHLLYIYLNGVLLDIDHFTRASIDVLYSSAIALIIQFPVRWWLGIYQIKKLSR